MKHKNTTSFWSSRFYEIIALFFFAFSFFVIVSLFSYHPLDPAFNSVYDNKISNAGGYIGAHISGFLLEFFGLSCALFPFFSFAWGVYFFRKLNPGYFPLRLSAFLLSLLLACYFLSSFNVSHSWQFLSYGGITGYFLVGFLEQYFNGIPFVISALFLFILCFYYALNMSLRKSFKLFFICFYSLVIYFNKKAKNSAILLAELSSGVLLNFNKRFFKNRIKDIDIGYSKPKEKISKIDKVSISAFKSNINYDLPDVNLLNLPKKHKSQLSKDELNSNAKLLKETLADFGINGKVLNVKPGPVVTLYEFEPAAGIKSSRVIGLADDVARSMRAISARISVISGQNALGIELPNENREVVYFRELVENDSFQTDNYKLPLALGKNIAGETVIADLAKMPHLLVAGTTGSGKSVAVNSMILSILYKLSPKECKFIMIDPKMLELSIYDDIPHLLSPVVTDPKKAVQVMRWTVQEMENRYRLMSSLGVRNITGYNEAIEKAIKKNKVLTRTVQTGFDSESGKPIFEEVELDMQPLPYIVLIVDEMADLMLVAGKEIECYIQRLAQMARAAGIHIIIATQRPSVDVITGVIKANFPTRISFQVTSKIDSRTILGEQGAEQLLGMGDMLYMFGGSKINRVHGNFVSDEEVRSIVAHLKKQARPEYIDDMFSVSEDDSSSFGEGDNSGKDELYSEAVEIIKRDKKVSTSYIQRQLRIGYNRAANIIEEMEINGIISSAGPTGKREILVE
ncbi:MAG: DNA translocase FtsK 4TM domain-containing protein [Rickettsiales bacterium]|nr:DNA translocase FtsK 4TM domain-containing protein [Rickettsiales bacterium]